MAASRAVFASDVLRCRACGTLGHKCAVLPCTCGGFARSIAHCAVTFAAARAKHALVGVAVGIGRHADAADFTALPLAFVDEAVGHYDLPAPVALTVQEFALVDRAVGIGHRAHAMVFGVKEFALVD